MHAITTTFYLVIFKRIPSQNNIWTNPGSAKTIFF